MLTLTKITDAQQPYFDACWDLYNNAFPLEERRDLDYFLESLDNKDFYFQALLFEQKLVGFISWWELENFLYVENFAIFPQFRGGGYGQLVLKMLKDISTKTIILEVEHPFDIMSERRISFYERNGFILNAYEYLQPPYRGTDTVPLLLMTYPKQIPTYDYNLFINKCLPIIHFRISSFLQVREQISI